MTKRLVSPMRKIGYYLVAQDGHIEGSIAIEPGADGQLLRNYRAVRGGIR